MFFLNYQLLQSGLLWFYCSITTILL